MLRNIEFAETSHLKQNYRMTCCGHRWRFAVCPIKREKSMKKTGWNWIAVALLTAVSPAGAAGIDKVGPGEGEVDIVAWPGYGHLQR